MKRYNGLALIILDGFGLSATEKGNAIKGANPEYINSLFKDFPFTELSAHGLDVGLPRGTMGNSEVGHCNIGAGRVVMQDLTRINLQIEEDTLKNNTELNNFLLDIKKGSSRVHLMGLLSESGVHSDMHHLFYLVNFFKSNGIKEIYIHAFLDGRDSPPKSATVFLEKLSRGILDPGKNVFLSTMVGRFYAMDRDTRWDRTKKAFDLLTQLKGEKFDTPFEALDKYYKEGITDEFMNPVVIDNGGFNGAVKTEDHVLFFNFRADRAKQITKVMTEEDFDIFPREGFRLDAEKFLSLTQYDDSFKNNYIIQPETYENILGHVIEKRGFRQFRTAETEKYAHVTYFFNCGKEEPFKNEDRLLVPSPREYPTYDLIPEMSALKVKEGFINKIKSGDYKLLVCNFANCDMVGHTGNYDAAVKAVKTIDSCIEEIVPELLKMDYACIITADHGNAETMIDENGSPMTNHTLNPVPFVIIGREMEKLLLKPGKLADIAPTILRLLEIDIPAEMTGKVLWE